MAASKNKLVKGIRRFFKRIGDFITWLLNSIFREFIRWIIRWILDNHGEPYLPAILTIILKVAVLVIACREECPECAEPPGIPKPLPPTAVAGTDQFDKVSGAVVTLDGSGSSDPIDDSTLTYAWCQVDNGAPLVLINNAEKERATSERLKLSDGKAERVTFEVPELSTDEKFEFKLTVTNNWDGVDEDDVLVHGKPKHRVKTSEVSGHTAGPDKTATFSVSLASKPTDEVILSVISTNENEGIAAPAQLTFRPRNWDRWQTVTVSGQETSAEGIQNYAIKISATSNQDPNYNSLDPVDVPMRGIRLSISQPDPRPYFIPGIETEFMPVLEYTGSNDLSWELLPEMPEGMTINEKTGIITWTAAESDRGRPHRFTVSVSDGSLSAKKAFEVTTSNTLEIKTNVDSGTLTVTDNKGDLKDLTLTPFKRNGAEYVVVEDVSDVELERLAKKDAPMIGKEISPLTDVLVVSQQPDADKVVIKYPLKALKEDEYPYDVNIYNYTEALDVEGKTWVSVFAEKDIDYDDSGNPVLVIHLNELNGLYMFGIQPDSQYIMCPSQGDDKVGLHEKVRRVNCEGEEYNKQTCTYEDGSDIEITVYGFGRGRKLDDDNNPTDIPRRWRHPGATIEELIAWLVSAHEIFDSYNLKYNKKFNVQLQHMEKGTLGFVQPGHPDTLNLTHDGSVDKTMMMGTAVHEYFHHAQIHTGGPSDDKDDAKSLSQTEFAEAIRSSTRKWIVEGTARWIEDEIFDKENTYVDKEKELGCRILEVGLAADSNPGNVQSSVCQYPGNNDEKGDYILSYLNHDENA